MEEDILKEIEKSESETKANEIIEIDENEEINNTQYDLQEVEEDKNDKKKKKKDKKPSKLKLWWGKLDKKKKIIIIVCSIVLLLLIAGIIVYFVFFNKKEEEVDTEPLVIIEKDNYRYEDGTLIFLDEDENELGKYECVNKDEDLCYVAYYSNEDDFDVTKNVYEDKTEIEYRSDIILDNYVFVYDNEQEEDGVLVLYNIDNEENEGEYDLVKSTKDDMVIVKSEDSYGLLSFSEDEISYEIKLSYDYMGYIEDSEYLVVADNNNYQLVDFTGSQVSKTVPGEIKNYDDNSISVLVDDEYYVYDYNGKTKIEDTYDYIRFVDTYIIAADGKKLFVYDYEGNPMNLSGAKINSTTYNTQIIFDEDLVQTDTEEAFSAVISGTTLTITSDEDVTTINLSEGAFNKNLGYISYFGGILYIYSDEEKTELLGTYTCSYANSIDSSTTELTNCFIAKESNLFAPDETLENGYLPIYNERYIFIADTKSPNANNNIVLYDLKNKKTLATYSVVDAGYHENTTSINFVSTAGTIVLAKNTSDSYGLINIASSSVTGLISFKNDSVTNTDVSILDDYLVFKRSDGTYHLYNKSGEELTSNISTTNEIVGYNGSYILVKTTSNNYMIYSVDGKITTSEYKYIIMESNVYITVNSNNVVGVYKYSDTATNLNENEELYAGSDYTSDISYTITNSKLRLTYKTSGGNTTVEISIG